MSAPHPEHARLVNLAREYLTADWCTERQVQQYCTHNSPRTSAPITPHHVRVVMMTLATQGIAQGTVFPGDQGMHWRRRAVA
jgi:hypothetical protein